MIMLKPMFRHTATENILVGRRVCELFLTETPASITPPVCEWAVSNKQTGSSPRGCQLAINNAKTINLAAESVSVLRHAFRSGISPQNKQVTTTAPTVA